MNRIIYKYQLPIADEGTASIHGIFEPLSLQVQHGVPTLWAGVDKDSKLFDVRYRVFGTGHLVTGIDAMTYLGTVQVASGLVFHYWMDVPPVIVH